MTEIAIEEPDVATAVKELCSFDHTEVDLTRTRQKKIAGFENYTKLEVLSLRWNLLTKIENLSPISATLVELDLYDNQIVKIENLDDLVNLRKLDLSFNRITKLESLDTLTNLESLFLTNNKITKIEGLENLAKLEYLELGRNQIAKIENLDANMALRSLYLGANNIERIGNVEGLTNLEVLSLPSNDIAFIEGLDTLVNLTQLSLSQNFRIEDIGNALQHNVKLESLDLHMCSLKHICGIAHLDNLIDVYFHGNQLTEWPEVGEQLSQLPKLEYVYLKENPFALDASYRTRAIQALPQVKEIDGDICRL